MMFKLKLAAFASTLILAGSVFAAPEAVCPDIEDIQSEALLAEQIAPNIYFGYNINTYNTSHNWGFVIAPIETTTKGKAVQIANELLDSMVGQGTPRGSDFVCSYNTGNKDILAYAIRDDLKLISPTQLKQFYQNNH